MREGYSQVVQQIQALEQYLLEHQPDLLWLSPLIRRQNLDHYKQHTAAARQSKKVLTQIRLLWLSLQLFLSPSQKLLRKKVDYFLLEHGTKRREWLDNSYFNRLPDALTHFLRPYGTVTLGEIINQPSQWKKQRWQASINLFPVTLATNIWLRIQKLRRQSPPATARLEQLEQIILDNKWDFIHFDAEAIRTDVMRILLFKRYFQGLLRRLQPKQVFSFCYYSKEAFGLTLAAKAMNIPVIEVQHGSQGSAHPMYAAYTGVYTGQFELLPDVLWVWSKSEEAYVKSWASSPSCPGVIRGGNPWLAYYKARISNQNQVRPSGHKRVLVSLQEPHYFHQSFLREMLHQSSPEVEWLLRVHPLYPELENELEEIFAQHPNIQVRGVAQQNLYQQFAEVDINITAFSTTCLEGLEFDVPSIIIHPNGKAYFEYYIKHGYFRYTEEATSCLRTIETHNFVRPPTELLQGDQKTIVQTIARLKNTDRVQQNNT